MYYPLLRGKQFELLAVRETMGEVVSANNVLPLIEPVNSNFRDILLLAKELETKKLGFILIVNPQTGDLAYSTEKVNNLVSELNQVNNHIRFAYWISGDTSEDSVSKFLNSYSNHLTYLVHASTSINTEKINRILKLNKNFQLNFFIKNKTSSTYETTLSGFKKAIIEDCFKKLSRNADYPSDEFFSKTVFDYLQRGYNGFGDFSIVGNSYSKGGGQAITAAIHLTYENTVTQQEIRVRHFLSGDRTEPEDASTLISEALPKLVKFIKENKNKFSFSHACQEFISIHDAGVLTNLGKIKKISIKHHMELMNHLLDEI